MFRYVAFAWSQHCADRAHRARALSARLETLGGWPQVADQPGFTVYCRGTSPTFLTPHQLEDQGGIVLGRLFDSSGRQSTALLRSCAPANRARALIDRSWGRYVAFLQNAEAGSIDVIRDPSGAVRCFFTTNGGVHVFCSHVEDIAGLGLPFSVNWNYVVAELANQAAMGWDQTGLNELTSLRAGECLEISERELKRFPLWDIVRFARTGLVDDTVDVRDIRDTIRHCVESWMSGHEHLALLLSGGLDSSVIASCFRDLPARPAVSCLNYFHDGTYRADERTYARLAADHAGCELVELERSTEVRLEALLDLPKSARPSHNTLDHLLNHERTTVWAKARGATAIMTGDLGDQLFCQQLSGHAPIDCLWARGFGRELMRVAGDVARIDSGAISRPLLAAIVYGYASRMRWLRGPAVRAEGRHELNPYLRTSAASGYDYRLQQRWLEAMHDLPVGKLLHIASIASAQAYLTPIGGADDPEWIAPLNSQPIVELCARIPIWKFVRNGHDRSLLREAFAQEVPTQIIRRRSKGTTSTQRVAVFMRNAEFVRKVLLEGVLAGRGLLDLDRIARDLRTQNYRHNVWLERCLRAETWLRTWGQNDARGPVADDHLSLSAKYVYTRAS